MAYQHCHSVDMTRANILEILGGSRHRKHAEGYRSLVVQIFGSKPSYKNKMRIRFHIVLRELIINYLTSS